MINGFNEQTSPLTDYEQMTLLPLIVKGLQSKVGRRSSITNKQMCTAMQRRGYDLNEARLRKVINHIRTKGIIPCLIATSSGYYIATEQKEMEDYIESLENRETAIREVREAMKSQYSTMFQKNEQLVFDF